MTLMWHLNHHSAADNVINESFQAGHLPPHSGSERGRWSHIMKS